MKLYKNLKFYFQKAYKINQRTNCFVAQNGNKYTKHSKLENKNTKARKSDYSNGSKNLSKEHPLCVTIAADSVSNNYVARLSKKICRNKNNVDNRHLNNFFVRSKQAQS